MQAVQRNASSGREAKTAAEQAIRTSSSPGQVLVSKPPHPDQGMY